MLHQASAPAETGCACRLSLAGAGRKPREIMAVIGRLPCRCAGAYWLHQAGWYHGAAGPGCPFLFSGSPVQGLYAASHAARPRRAPAMPAGRFPAALTGTCNALLPPAAPAGRQPRRTMKAVDSISPGPGGLPVVYTLLWAHTAAGPCWAGTSGPSRPAAIL